MQPISAASSKATGLVNEFKVFITKGDVINLAIAFIMGGAFTAIVNSMVKDIISPIIGLINQKDLSESFWVMKEGETASAYATREEAIADSAVTLNWGSLVNTIINFLIISLFCFFLAKLVILIMRKKDEAPKETCRFCCEEVKSEAKKCPHCKSNEPLSEIQIS